jgi:hypothetical protein
VRPPALGVCRERMVRINHFRGQCFYGIDLGMEIGMTKFELVFIT